MDAKLQDKLSKILAMTTSPNEHEAATAASLLQDLLTKHNLSVADLEKKGAKAPPVGEQRHDLGKAAFKWKLDLAEAIAEHFYCHALVSRYTKTVAFVGRPDNVASLQSLYSWLIEQIRQISAEERRTHQLKTGEHVDPLRWQVNFGVGCVERLGARLHERKEQMDAEMARNADGDVVALTIHHESEISDFLEQTRGYRVDDRETKKERERRERYEAEQKKKVEWLARDPASYYKAYPYEDPAYKAMQEEQNAKEWAEYEKKQRKNDRARERRRERGVGGWGCERTVSPEEARRQEQAHVAERAGRNAASKVNLEPFLKGHVPNDPAKRIK